jgi:hypothetical protein
MLGTLMRLPLRLIPDGIVLPILLGPGGGSRWVVGTLTHGCWIGTYERRVQDQLAHILRLEMLPTTLAPTPGSLRF